MHIKKDAMKFTITMFVIVIGAGSFFLTNLYYAKILPPSAYSFLIILYAITSNINAFGLLGSNQALLRWYLQKDGKSEQRFLYSKDILLLTLIFPFFILLYLYMINIKIDILFIIFIYSILLNIISYNSMILRANVRFIASQILLQTPKLLFLLFTLYFSRNINYQPQNYIVVSLLIAAFIPITCFYILEKKNVTFRKEPILMDENFKSDWFCYIFIIGTGAVLTTFDRYLLGIFDPQQLAQYGYLFALTLGPISLLQNGIGFILMPIIRKDQNYSIKKFTQKHLKYIFFIAIGLGICLYPVTFFIHNIVSPIYEYDNLIIILLLIVGIVRLIYTSFSSIVGAKFSTNELKSMTNALNWSTGLMVFLTFLFYIVFKSIEIIAISLLMGWVSRNIIFYLFIKRKVISAY